jgi:hypothetical protein
MYSDFKSLKKASSMGELTKKLVSEAEKMSNVSSSRADRIFTVERDPKTGRGVAIVRLLPPPPNEPAASVKLVNHNFKYNGKYLNENCPRHTPGVKGDCPICDSNRELWATQIEANKSIASKRKLRTSYYMNVYVVKNPAKPELEGRVMLYRCGVKIFEKIENARVPQYEGDTNVLEPFNMFGEGANLRIVAKTVKDGRNGEDYPNYDETTFEAKAPLLDGDDETLEKIWGQCHSLQDLIAPEKFHSYEEIQKNLDRVMGAKPVGSNSVVKQNEELEELTRQVNDDNIMEELEATYRNHSAATNKEPSTMDEALSAFENLDDDEDLFAD